MVTPSSTHSGEEIDQPAVTQEAPTCETAPAEPYQSRLAALRAGLPSLVVLAASFFETSPLKVLLIDTGVGSGHGTK